MIFIVLNYFIKTSIFLTFHSIAIKLKVLILLFLLTDLNVKMKFGANLQTIQTPEWRSQYLEYEVCQFVLK